MTTTTTTETIVNDMGTTIAVKGKPRWCWVVQVECVYDMEAGVETTVFTSRRKAYAFLIDQINYEKRYSWLNQVEFAYPGTWAEVSDLENYDYDCHNGHEQVTWAVSDKFGNYTFISLNKRVLR